MGTISFRRICSKTAIALLPRQCRLTARYWKRWLTGEHEPELRHLHRLVRRSDVALDIGANEGMFAYRMSKLFSQVMAFEVNPDITTELQWWGRENIKIHRVGLSSRNGEATLFTPLLHGTPLTGWASLNRGNCPAITRHAEKQVQLRTLDDLHIQSVSLIKIDVEGHELEVLLGGQQTISRDRPVIFVEVKQDNRERVRDFFRSLNYRETRLNEFVPVKCSEDNLIYLPD